MTQLSHSSSSSRAAASPSGEALAQLADVTGAQPLPQVRLLEQAGEVVGVRGAEPDQHRAVGFDVVEIHVAARYADRGALDAT